MTFIEVFVNGEEAVVFTMEFCCDDVGQTLDVRMQGATSALPPIMLRHDHEFRRVVALPPREKGRASGVLERDHE